MNGGNLEKMYKNDLKAQGINLCLRFKVITIKLIGRKKEEEGIQRLRCLAVMHKYM